MGLKLFSIFVAAALTGCTVQRERSTASEPWYGATNENGDPVFAVFEGRVPCVEPTLKDCEKIKVALALYRDRRTEAPTTYALARVHVASSPEGSRAVVIGTWRVTRGMPLDANAPVYELDASAPAEFRLYWRIGENILFVLDSALNPRVGTASWSYALNRTR